MTENDKLMVFADDAQQNSLDNTDFWDILIVDDEEEVHHITKLVLSGFVFANKPVRFISAFSAAEAEEILKENQDIAVILLDVVMENNNSGLDLVKFIRDKLKNRFIRIILRTGQPGSAPEGRVIVEYDINDYKEKTELTAKKLFTTMVSAIRSYRDLMIIEKNRYGLEKIVNASAKMFELQSLPKFASGILEQLIGLLFTDKQIAVQGINGFTATMEKSNLHILAARGRFNSTVDKNAITVLDKKAMNFVSRCIKDRQSRYEHSTFAAYIETKFGSVNIIYLENCDGLTPLDLELIDIYCFNVTVAFENIILNKELEETQKEFIFRLGKVIENRSHDTDTNDHVKRVASLVKLFALKCGLSEDEADLVSVASAIHDIGKLAIPDDILLKPGNLTLSEFNIMKRHTEFGHEMFEHSRRNLFGAAAVIAYQHHERWDGTGYPTGASGEQINFYARITSVADVFDALTHKRIYNDETFCLEAAIDYIKSQSGKQFDPKLVEIFISNADEFAKAVGLIK